MVEWGKEDSLSDWGQGDVVVETPPDTSDFKTKEETPSGDKFVFAPVSFRKPIPKAYENLLGKDANWDELLLLNERVELRDALVDWGDYDESGSKTFNAIYFANQFGLEPEIALGLHDELSKITFHEEGPPE